MIAIEDAKKDDIEKIKPLYEKYLSIVYSNFMYNGSEVTQLFESIDIASKLASGINSPLAKILLFKKNETIVGFLESYIVKKSEMFEREHIYIANLFFDHDVVEKEMVFGTLNQAFELIKSWAKMNKIQYICNDVDDSNIVMKHINQVAKFIPYRTRYYRIIE